MQLCLDSVRALGKAALDCVNSEIERAGPHPCRSRTRGGLRAEKLTATEVEDLLQLVPVALLAVADVATGERTALGLLAGIVAQLKLAHLIDQPQHTDASLDAIEALRKRCAPAACPWRSQAALASARVASALRGAPCLSRVISTAKPQDRGPPAQRAAASY